MFDNVCKFLAENYASDFAQWVFGEPKGLTVLSPTELSNEPIRADALIMLQSEDVVLHLEFQTIADAAIPFRMADYRLRVYRKYPQKQMKQVVIYLKETTSAMVQENSFTISGMNHQFEVIRLWEQPTAELLKSPGLLPFAILSQSDNRARTLQEVGSEIDRIDDRREKSNVTAATSILAGLVLKKNVIQTILREEIMRESVIYQDIIAQGEAKGVKKGELSLVLRQLKRRIGTISAEDESLITNLSVEQLEDLGEALLDFSSQDDLSNWLADN